MTPTDPRLIAESVRADLLSEWLLMSGFAEAERGYGHVSADALAEALLERFEMYVRQIDGSGGDDGTR